MKVHRSFMKDYNSFYIYIWNSLIELKRILTLKKYEATLDKRLNENRGKEVKKSSTIKGR